MIERGTLLDVAVAEKMFFLLFNEVEPGLTDLNGGLTVVRIERGSTSFGWVSHFIKCDGVNVRVVAE